MMQPKFLFISTQGELILFDLTKKPIKNPTEIQERILRQVKTIQNILDEFQEYSREKMESYDFSVSNVFGGSESQFIKDLNSLEEKFVKQVHLSLLSKFLMGDIKDDKLFFWAYKFKFIPIEIISSIYEEFYHEENFKDTKGTNYTPSTLVEFLVSDTLTSEILRKKPKILDPACGSGIFLVEAFKRIIRYDYFKKKKKLSFIELNSILKNQIFGIEINPEALKITSFSLYLALLNHLEPKDILANISQKRKLPPLVSPQISGKPPRQLFLLPIQFQVFPHEGTVWLVFGNGKKFKGGLSENKITRLESELDKAIYELFNLNESEIDLIEETCQLRLDLLLVLQKGWQNKFI